MLHAITGCFEKPGVSRCLVTCAMLAFTSYLYQRFECRSFGKPVYIGRGHDSYVSLDSSRSLTFGYSSVRHGRITMHSILRTLHRRSFRTRMLNLTAL